MLTPLEDVIDREKMLSTEEHPLSIGYKNGDKD